MGAEVEAMLLEPLRTRPYWGPRRPAFELAGHAAAAAQAAGRRSVCRLSAYSEVIFSRLRARSNSVARRRKPLKLHGRPVR
jgi:hypothetical protein